MVNATIEASTNSAIRKATRGFGRRRPPDRTAGGDDGISSPCRRSGCEASSAFGRPGHLPRTQSGDPIPGDWAGGGTSGCREGVLSLGSMYGLSSFPEYLSGMVVASLNPYDARSMRVLHRRLSVAVRKYPLVASRKSPPLD